MAVFTSQSFGEINAVTSATFSHAIVNIVGVRTKTQMIRINTKWNVEPVHDNHAWRAWTNN